MRLKICLLFVVQGKSSNCLYPRTLVAGRDSPMDMYGSRHRTVLYHKALFVHYQCLFEESALTRSLTCRNRVVRVP